VNLSDISIVIPAFNEAEAVGTVVRNVKQALPQCELIVVDDGSTDSTAEIARNAGAKVVSHVSNTGYGAAIKSGLLRATGVKVLFCDADGQHRAEDVKRIAELGIQHDIVVGVRDNRSHVNWRRVPGKWFLRRFADFLAGERIPDLNCGLRLFKKEILLQYLHLLPQGFSLSTTSTFAMIKGGYQIVWEPITAAHRTGTSQVRQWKHGPSTLLLMVRLTVLFQPLRVFLFIAVLLLALAIASATWNLVLSKGATIGMLPVIFAIATLQVFLFGLLCDQISAVRREMHEKRRGS
jgi:glycosyltransferase involved in cell wall biosynthesis